MYILAIETTGAFASVALAKAEGTRCDILSHVHGHDRFSHLQNLTPQINEVLTEAALSIDDIGAIAVSHGPGSFTGIRIGVSTARALAQAKGITCIPVSSLQALAKRTEGTDFGYKNGYLVCPIFDARRSQVYGAGYFFDEAIDAGPYTIEEFMDEIAMAGHRKVIFMGDGIDAYRERIEEIAMGPGHNREFDGVDIAFAPEKFRYQDADTVASLGAILLDEGRGCSFEELKPEYMRLAEAERKLKAGAGSKPNKESEHKV